MFFPYFPISWLSISFFKPLYIRCTVSKNTHAENVLKTHQSFFFSPRRNHFEKETLTFFCQFEMESFSGCRKGNTTKSNVSIPFASLQLQFLKLSIKWKETCFYRGKNVRSKLSIIILVYKKVTDVKVWLLKIFSLLSFIYNHCSELKRWWREKKKMLEKF